ncbi:alkaline phosphatase family protein [Flavobacterium sp. LS1P28]|uniref:Alkaline phosphatase family protein n=1 Tax=Flavobacterium bomense TaxID=2497483 RepID=A0A432CN42_9FLAO|nr:MULTISPECIES: alkaline phosphatase PafA [Flavobacterium]RTY74534.1 alkaline phosphatase family protein [Flavobacterium sp. LS1R10]RTY80723.1 alkaline phosphatase family protein [Flavobacterium sp. LS1P28]RTY87876.1 alkaline phosphatase family protein [Flavobacterium sp. RSP15]RTZ03961.1 alkaline phosphatase family protein [Flavobacterium sp. GSP6]RTZ05251.1 alkaline phosphatase family protein [Flavobacterium bomense]
MKKIFLFCVFILMSNLQAQQRPKLVVGIVVDQMKMEYLYRFSDDFSSNGFKRLMDKGYTFHNMHYNFVPTYTAPGHASIFTGATPSTHGIVGNDWFNKATGKDLYCTDDASVKTVGDGLENEGAMSPKNLLSTTITDELRMATNFEGKVIGLSIKDRGAILPAGHFANWAFWYSKTGAFISSTFYGLALPDWVTEFNEEKRYMNYINRGWDLFKPVATYNESLADDNPYEGKLDKTKRPVFPYDLKEIYKEKGADILRSTPFGNDILADLAMKAIENESLGKDDITDFLTVSFSSTDYVGHTFGPRSMELQDTYLRLDETIAQFLTYLDKTVGKDNYLLFLTADHAGAENPNYLKDNKYNVKNIPSKDIVAALKKFSNESFGADLVLDYSNFNLFFNTEIIKNKGLDMNVVKQSFKTFLMTQEQVKRVYTEEEILASSGDDYFLSFISKGYDPRQNGEIVVLDKAGYMQYQATGTTHGTLNSYDTHVPLLFYGWKVPKGELHAKKYITQIAPTLSQMLKIPFPNGTESEVLDTLLDDDK